MTEFPKSLETICEYAFSKTNIKIEAFPKNIKVIGKGAFLDCHNIEKILIPSSLQKICYRAFYNCQNIIEVINESFCDYEGEVFAKCSKISSFRTKKPNNQIHYSVFKDCNPDLQPFEF